MPSLLESGRVAHSRLPVDSVFHGIATGGHRRSRIGRSYPTWKSQADPLAGFAQGRVVRGSASSSLSEVMSLQSATLRRPSRQIDETSAQRAWRLGSSQRSEKNNSIVLI